MIFRKLALFIAALWILPHAVFASSATLSGRVVDPNGRAIAGAEVELRNPQTGASLVARTNDEGLYIIPEILPGQYEFKVSRAGFQSLVKKDLTVNVGAKLAENVTLQVGRLEEEVTVEAEALALEKDSAAVSTVINRAFVENLPLNGRSFQTLIELAPGGRRLNRAAFAEPSVGTQGNLRRNSLRGFPFYQTDLSLRRQIRFGERLRVQLRADLFNAFNHPNFADPVTTYNFPESQFGRPTQMLNRQLGGASGTFNPLYQIGGPRSVQLSVKFIY